MVKPNAEIIERLNLAFESNKLWPDTSMRATLKNKQRVSIKRKLDDK